MLNKSLKILCAISGLIFICSSIIISYILITENKDKQAFKELAEIVEKTDNISEYDALYKQNNDMYGWIKIKDTNINYPVMFTPDKPQYYLKRAFDKSFSVAGTPFIDEDCTPEGNVYIIYGHRMNNGTMFSELANYTDKEYWKEHKIINFDTLDQKGEYEVFAVFLSRVYSAETHGFRYYEYTDLTNKTVFDNFIKEVKNAALYNTDIDINYGDKLLILSTCNHYTENGRLVIAARFCANKSV